MSAQPDFLPATDFDDDGAQAWRHGDWVWLPLRGMWRDVSRQPEEVVRQEWVRRLVADGGYSLDQIDQERRTAHGRGSPRADIVVWRSASDKHEGAAPWLVIETKAGAVRVSDADFLQGETYARAAGAPFLICATATDAEFFELLPGVPGQARQLTDWPRVRELEDSGELAKLRAKLKSFDRAEFQRVLSDSHNLLRDAHALSPDAAFDTISKILFIKLNIERNETHGTFTAKFLDERARFAIAGDRPVHEGLFESAKGTFKYADLFSPDEQLNISESTFRSIVKKLERFNLSQTGEDIKGIAFEQFLGRTFRGELGQFFTPRPVVDFMIDVLNPQEGEQICDPAAGSGGFLIRAFQHVMGQIGRDIKRQQLEATERISAEYGSDADDEALAERDARAEQARLELANQLKVHDASHGPAATRAGQLAGSHIWGTDKEARAARTAKMNMILHGDGHTGVHWHDGLIDVAGIFEGRFDVVVTNPPFGSRVNDSMLVGATPVTDVPNSPEYVAKYNNLFGNAFHNAYERVKQASGTKILEQFELGAGRTGAQTEVLFIERCLDLLKPGGRLGIVLPNGVLNSASLGPVRRWVEGRAYIRGVFALPPETFRFSGATVTASILLIQKFTDDDETRWVSAWALAHKEVDSRFDAERAGAFEEAEPAILTGGDADIQSNIDALTALGGVLALPRPAPAFDLAGRGNVSTTLANAKFTGSSSSAAQERRREIAAKRTSSPGVIAATNALKARLASIDQLHSDALWSHVRASFRYPVFGAKPGAVGISATGDTGPHVPNQLPDVAAAWGEFIAAESIPGWPA